MSNYKSGGRSVAAWCKLRESSNNNHGSKMQLHFNYWRVGSSIPQHPDERGIGYDLKRYASAAYKKIRPKRHAEKSDFLDIGVMVTPFDDLKDVEGICIYLPVPLDAEDIKDLGPLFKNTNVATGIFNERLEVRQESSRRVELGNQEGQFCRVHNFSTSNNGCIDDQYLKVEPYKGGTKLTITSAAIQAAHREINKQKWIYFRFRVFINNSGRNSFVKTIRPEDKFILSGFHATEYVDFRLNEARNLPPEVEELMEDAEETGVVPIVRIDFLLVLRVGADLDGGHTNYHKSRLLERELWLDYVPDGGSDALQEGMVIYHWREKKDSGSEVGFQPSKPKRPLRKSRRSSPEDSTAQEVLSKRDAGIKEFNAFVKLNIRVSNWKTVALSLSIIVILGAAGSYFGSLITSYLSSSVDHQDVYLFTIMPK
ncbi:hypothetical protein [Onishia niordana]|uniref:hypothetical protein n=1 Tax=Onishia niordana TaxID=2508711 RepID=UPI0010A0B54D|nr:hypothetical protein [Halomonas niordiana]